MSAFILWAAFLTAAVAGLIVVPLVRKREAGGRAPLAAFVAVAVLAGGGTALYAGFSNWSWKTPSAAGTPEAMVAQLARRLERSPDDLDGWLKLGRSYLVLEQYSLAGRAYQRADRLAGSHNADALTGLAEALALGDERELDGRAGRLLEQALVVDPRSPKALYYGALTALRRGDLLVARGRFASLLELDPPDNIKPVLQRQIDSIDAQTRPGSTVSAQKPAATQVRLQVRVSLSPALRAKVDAATPMFVIVREPGVRGPPLAVKRLASRFPQSLELTPADSMLAGRSFSGGQVVEVVARIALSGNPVGATGDPFGLITVRVGENRTLDLTIDRLSP